MSEKAFPLNLQKYQNLNLIKHSRFLILHFQVYKQLLRVIGTISVRNYTVDKFESRL